MANLSSIVLRLGTRGSLLARTQSGIVAAELQRVHPGLRVELITITTSGDQITDKPLHAFGGKGLFTKELEQALLEDRVDFAVHSFKDVPTTMPLVDQDDLVIAAVPKREDPRDLLVAAKPMTIADLPHGARVGTGSLRRRCQLLAIRPDLQIEPIRGNIDTRLRKQREGQYDAIVLALAGVRRAGLFEPATMQPIDPAELLPAPGQGALALQSRKGDSRMRELLMALNDVSTAACVLAEREVVARLQGDCMSPIAALAEIKEGRLTLRAAVGSRGGTPPLIHANANSPMADPISAANDAFVKLATQDAMKLLHGS